MLNVDTQDRDNELVITGGDVLVDGAFHPNEAVTAGVGQILSLGSASYRGTVVNASGLLVMPGVVDIHGDAFERQLMPRPGVHFPHSLALLDTDRQLLANGITTAFHGLTWSWEPGLRGKEAAYSFMEALEDVRERLGCDTRLHLRFETHNLGDVGEVDVCLKSGRVDLLAFNDHTGHLTDVLKSTTKAQTLAGRSGLSLDEYRKRIESLLSRAGEVPAACARLAKTALGMIPMASHDDDTPEIRAHYRGLGCLISEFPTCEEAARAAKDHDEYVVLGAPNVLRGRSHLAAGMDARQAVSAGLCDILASDYYYPALTEAPFILEHETGLPLAETWKLVSENPAKAAGLHDRGVIAPGKRADMVLVDVQGARPRIMATIVAGRLVHASREIFPRLCSCRAA